jgi:hypothetical protein
MRSKRPNQAGGGNLVKDYQFLRYVLESHHLQKNKMRN